jgi:hypothetical protein
VRLWPQNSRGSVGVGLSVRVNHNCLWVAAPIGIAILCLSSCSQNRSNERQLAAAENEVYAAAVRQVVKTDQIHGELIFWDTVLTRLSTGTKWSCEQDVRQELFSEKRTLPYDSLADKVYRLIVYRYVYGYRYDYSLKSDTVQDFAAKDCTDGRLSRTFHTDSPKLFTSLQRIHFSDPSVHDGSKSFEQLFPGAGGIIALSHVGFDSVLDQAIVSISSACGPLCGSDGTYILQKKRSHWEVVDTRVIGMP